MAVLAQLASAVKDFFGLKGRFYQPRPKAWERRFARDLALKGPFVRQSHT